MEVVFVTGVQSGAYQGGSGVSESELIRRAIDDSISGANMVTRPDPSALGEILAFIQTLKESKPEGQPIQFKRQEFE